VLINLINDVDQNTIIVIEDIDVCMATRVRKRKEGESKGDKTEGVTLSGLLNVLDGAMTPDNQIFIMTTNHPENLDPALLRNGRVDVHMKFSYMEAELVKEMFTIFFPEHKRDAAKVAKALTANGAVSPAKIQGMLFEYAKDPKAFIKESLKNDVDKSKTQTL